MKKIIFLTFVSYLTISCNFFTNPEDAGKTPPTLGEVIVTEITATGATFTSSVDSYGSYSIIETGFSYGPDPKPYETGYAVAADYIYSYKTEFSASVSDLQPNTTYYVTPYVKVGESKYFVGKKQEVLFTTKVQGDYSSAKVESDNRNVEIHLRSCYRNGNRVKIEATILNKGINNYANYYMYPNNQGYNIGYYTYYGHVEDDLYTSYADGAVTKTLNNQSSYWALNTQLPIGATKILTLAIDGVPSNAKIISVYIASEFQNTTPTEYAYLTFENVPIY